MGAAKSQATVAFATTTTTTKSSKVKSNMSVAASGTTTTKTKTKSGNYGKKKSKRKTKRLVSIITGRDSTLDWQLDEAEKDLIKISDLLIIGEEPSDNVNFG